MSGENVNIFTAAGWNQAVLDSDKPVLVDFWASWCGPCRMIAPIVEELATEYNGKVTVGKLNVDEQGAIARQYNVTGIPTLGLFKDGKMVERLVGLRPKAELVKVLDSALSEGRMPEAE